MQSEPNPAIPPEVAQRAVQWWVEMQGAGAAADAAARAGLARWRAEHPLHDAAWRHIETVQGRFTQLAAGLDAGAARAALLPARSPKRRAAIKALALLVFAGGGVWTLDPARQWAVWTADARTAVGERRRMTLADGTEVVLNTDSAIDVRFDASTRRIVLLRGEIMVTSGHERRLPARPLVVAAAPGELTPLGTRFGVRLDGAVLRVGVFEGAVRAQPGEPGAASRVIAAGRRAAVTLTAVSEPQPLGAYAGSWTDGTLVASRLRLGDLVAELARYRHGYLQCDPAVAGLRVSGSYPLDDADRVFETLRATLPIDVESFTRYWVRIVPSRA
ncbi:FecR domain-containing protein [Burkholderia plantarii]|uniref:Fe2+-dicitrate sensor, membrane component n=1 Tax=Burkholderia plantarii TaxID=41899 RepID=A0A0B6S169_BURPL|nr:FecR domain-containing protein [Burkholderia plantarii]AJK49378.1 Fe2+-dicitrate sensor, membrane component [Burkholderia plantarii]ALK33619.1 Fe2+-dicitrate sensor, membrane component [Burkholderia plantarii]GLZ16783.1 iron uptake regulator [Burkholderia plantarii]